MANNFDYHQRMDVKFDHLEPFDTDVLVDECREQWFNQTLTKVNDSVVRLGIIEGDYHWHQHDEDDEFFFVLSGFIMGIGGSGMSGIAEVLVARSA